METFRKWMLATQRMSGSHTYTHKGYWAICSLPEGLHNMGAIKHHVLLSVADFLSKRTLCGQWEKSSYSRKLSLSVCLFVDVPFPVKHRDAFGATHRECDHTHKLRDQTWWEGTPTQSCNYTHGSGAEVRLSWLTSEGVFNYWYPL